MTLKTTINFDAPYTGNLFGNQPYDFRGAGSTRPSRRSVTNIIAYLTDKPKAEVATLVRGMQTNTTYTLDVTRHSPHMMYALAGNGFTVRHP